MAIDLGEDVATEAECTSRAVVSLASEVFWVLLAATKDEARELHPELAGLYRNDPELRERVANFWDGERPCYDELAVLAHFGGVLTGAPALSDFVDAVRDAALRVPDRLRLGSESPAHRARLLTRLERLRSDRALRGRYTRMLEDVWSPLDRAWRDGLPVLEAASTRLDGLLATGAVWTDLLPSGCDVFHFEQLRQAQGREIIASTPGRVAISRFAAKLWVVDLTEILLCSAGLPGIAVAERERAALLGRQMRAIADATRLTLLRLLAPGGERVGELAAQLGVSQPTVSNHLKLLKASGFVRSERRNGRQLLAVDRAALDRALADVAGFIASLPHS